MYEFKVSEMTCGGCANSIKYALQKVDPLVEVRINLKNQTVQVKTEEKESVVGSIIEQAGFPVLDSKKIS